MNRIFKSKWCAATQSYVACSELAKRAGKVASCGAVLLAVSSVVNAADTLPITISTTQEIVGQNHEKRSLMAFLMLRMVQLQRSKAI